jgi:uncharacterized Zn-finger protein
MRRGNRYHPAKPMVNQRALLPLKLPVAMQTPETLYVEDVTVACDGGDLGHPRVYLNLENKGAVDCPYCGRHFVLRSADHSAPHRAA